MAKEKICGIYCIENLVNGKKYIGKSVNIKGRFLDHKSALKRNKHSNIYLQREWNKYDSNNFKFIILEQCEINILNNKEQYYIDFYSSNDNMIGYNLTSGGEKSCKVNESIQERKSIITSKNSILQFTIDGAYIKKWRNPRLIEKQLHIDGENIRLCCDKKYGRKTVNNFIWLYEKDFLENGLDLNYYKPLTNSKNILQYDLDNNFIAEYKSAREAEKQTGIGYKMISRVCNGKRPHTHGYVFKFTS